MTTFLQVAVNKSGVFQYTNYNLYEDNGYAVNENLSQFGVNVYNNCYNAATWNHKCYDTLTDTAKNTWFRSPGNTYTSIIFKLTCSLTISLEFNLF